MIAETMFFSWLEIKRNMQCIFYSKLPRKYTRCEMCMSLMLSLFRLISKFETNKSKIKNEYCYKGS